MHLPTQPPLSPPAIVSTRSIPNGINQSRTNDCGSPRFNILPSNPILWGKVNNVIRQSGYTGPLHSAPLLMPMFSLGPRHESRRSSVRFCKFVRWGNCLRRRRTPLGSIAIEYGLAHGVLGHVIESLLIDRNTVASLPRNTQLWITLHV